MENEILNLDILGNINVGNLEQAREVLNQIVTSASKMSEEMNKVKGSTGLFTRQLEGCADTADLLNRKIESFNKETTGNNALFEDEVQQRMAGIKDMAADLQTMTGLLFNDGAFSANAAHKLLKGLPSAVAREFNAIAPRIVSQLNGKMSGMKLDDNIKIFDDIGGVKNIFDTFVEKNKKAFTTKSGNLQHDRIEGLKKLLIQNASPMYLTGEYRQNRLGDRWYTSGSNSFRDIKKDDLLPSLYRDVFKNKGYSFSKRPDIANNARLSDSYARELQTLLSSNKFAREAAVASGFATRKGGSVTYTYNPTQDQLGSLSTSLYDMFIKRISGMATNATGRVDIYDDKNNSSVVKRMLNGGGASILAAMQSLDRIINGSKFNGETKAITHNIKEPDRLKEMYAIPTFDLNGARNKNVAISESQITDLLGLTGNDYSLSDVLAEIDLGEYNYKNKKQEDLLRHAIKNGINGYQFHSFHGTGPDMKARFVRTEAADALRSKYKGFAEKYGFAGTDILHSFMPDTASSANEFGKMQDELGKIWTDGVKTNKSLDDKTFAAVNFGALKGNKWHEFIDGMNIMMDSVVDDSGQTRFALGVKGSNSVLRGFNTFGDWARNAGIIGDNQRLYLPGLRAASAKEFDFSTALNGTADPKLIAEMLANGQLVDVTDVNGGLVDASTIKNKSAYSKMASSAEINKALTALTRLTGIRTPANYEEESTNTMSLGPQASGFIRLSDGVMNSQNDYVEKVLASLNTIEGVRKYVFSGQTDYLAKLVNDPEKVMDVIGTNSVQERIKLFRDSFINKYLSGDIFNIGDGTISVAQNRTLANPLAAFAGVNGGHISDAQYRKYSQILSKANNKEYSKQEIEDLINLKDAAISFELADMAEKTGYTGDVGFLRSPSAYGAIVTRKNIAKEIEPLFDALGISKVGTFLNAEDLKILQGADLDGDRIKAMIGTIVDDLKRTQQQYTDILGDDFTPAGVLTSDPKFKGLWSLSNPDALLQVARKSKEASYGMARASNIGTRMVQYNLNDPANGFLSVLAANANPMYDFYTTQQKTMQEALDNSYVAIGAGNEFAKLPARLGRIFDVSLDEDGVARNGNGDIVSSFRDKKGRLINRTALDELKVDSFNMPSLYNDASIKAMMQSKRLYNKGYLNQDYVDELVEIFTEGADYNGFDPFDSPGTNGNPLGNLMRNMRRIRAEFLGGARTGISADEENILSKQLVLAEKQINDMVAHPDASSVNPESGIDTKDKKALREYYMRNYGIYQAQQMLGRYLLDVGNGKKMTVGLGYTEAEQARMMSNERQKMIRQTGTSLDNILIGDMSEQDLKSYVAKEENRKKLVLAQEKDNEYITRTREIDKDLIKDGVIMAKERDGSIVPLGQHEYHFSELHSALTNPAQWYNSNMANIPQSSPDISLGLATHETLEDIMKDNIGKKVSEFFDGDNAAKLFDEKLDDAFGEKEYSKTGREEKIDYAKQFVKNLGKIIGDETVVGAEGELKGTFNTEVGNLKYAGNYDLLTRDKDGNLILSDYKPRTSYKDVFEQLQLYGYMYNKQQEERAEFDPTFKPEYIKKLRVLGYGNKGNTPEASANMMEYDERKAEEIYRKYSNAARVVHDIREASLDKDQALSALNNNRLILNNAVQQTQEVREATTEERSAFGERATSIKAEVDKNSARNIAYELELQKMVAEYEGKLNGIENSIDRHRRPTDARRPNFWDATKYALDAGFDNEIADLQARGVGEAEINTLTATRNKIVKKFNLERDVASSADITKFYDDLTGKMNDEQLSGQLRNYIKLTEELQHAFEEAVEAKQSLETERANIKDKIKTGKATDDEKNRLPVLEELIRRAEDEETMAREKKEERMDQLKEKTKKSLTDSLNALFSEHTGVKNPVLSVDNQVASFIDNKKTMLATIEEAKARGVIDDDTYNSMSEKAKAMNSNQYKERLYNNLLGTSTRQIDRTLESMDSISMNRNYRYRRDVWSRAQFNALSEYKSRQQMQDQMQKELDNAVSIRDEFAESKDTDKYNEAAANVERLTAAMADNERQMSSLRGISGMLNKTIEELGYSVSQVVARFGRQMFQRAIQEAKRFIVSFDTAMSQIQTITMKSDEEMQAVRKQTIDKAIELHTSVANVSDVEAALYRQGLSDSEVSSRTDSIIKFATVTGVKAVDATKALTAAVKSGLVSSVDEAMDAMSALGDNAATTAQEIFKGMQKSVGAAKQANMSFAELTALLTIGTEKTQLSGTQVGTAINTMLQRMQRVTTDKYVTDEDGNTTDINNVESALRLAGVNLRDDTGNFRRGFDVLRDLATNWNNLNSLQRSNVTYAMAGTRANIFQNLMEGMGEDGGATLDEYLGLAENSQGITDNKYDIYIQNIASSIETLKSAFDGFVESLEGNGLISGTIDVITGLLQGLTDFSNNAGGIATALGLVGAAVAAFAAKIIVLKAAGDMAGGNYLGTIAALLTGGSILAAMSQIGKSTSSSRAYTNEDLNNYLNNTEKNKDKYTSNIEALESIKSDYFNGQIDFDTASKKFNKELKKISNDFPELSSYLIESTSSLEAWTAAIDKSKDVVDSNKRSDILGMYVYAPDTIASNVNAANEKVNNIPVEFVDSINRNLSDYLEENSPIGIKWSQDFSNLSNTVNSFLSLERTDSGKAKNPLIDLINSIITQTGEFVVEGVTATTKYTSVKSLMDEYTNYNTEEKSTFATDVAVALDRQYSEYVQKTIERADAYIASVYEEAMMDIFENGIGQVVKRTTDNEDIYDYATSTVLSYYGTDTTQNDITRFFDNYEKYINDDGLLDEDKYMSDVMGVESESPKYYRLNNGDLIPSNMSKEEYMHKKSMELATVDGFTDAYVAYLNHPEDEDIKKRYEDLYQKEIDARQAVRDAAAIEYSNRSSDELYDENGDRYKINSDGDLVTVTTNKDILSSVSLSNKDKGYRDEYRTLAKYLATVGDITSWLNEDSDNFANVLPMLQNDSTFVDMLRSVSNGTGEYDMNSLMNYIQEKAYGSSYGNSFSNIDSLYSLQKNRNLFNQIGEGNISTDIASQISNALGIDPNMFYNNQDYYLQRYQNMMNTNEQNALSTATSDINGRIAAYSEEIGGSANFEDVMKSLESSMDLDAFEEFKNLVDAYKNVGIEFDYDDSGLHAAISDLEDYGDMTDNAIKLMQQLKGSAKDASAGLKSFGSVATDAADNQFFREKYKAGDRSKETLTAISKMTNIGQDALSTMKMEDILPILNLSETADLQDVNDWAAGFNEQLALAVQGAVDAGAINVPVDGGIVNLDFGAVFAALTAQGLDAVNGCIAILQSIYAQGQLNVETDAEGKVVTASFDVTSLGKGRSSSGKSGGGGGGGKSKSAKLIEELKREKELIDHRVKMVRYQETKYQNADELGNYGRMLEVENEVQEDLRRIITENIAKLEDQITKVKKGSDDWYDLRKAVMEYEEELEDINNTIAENTKKLKENEQAILKLHTDLEDAIREEIETRIQDERDMLDGTVSIEDIILDAIRNRYQVEWDMLKLDIEKKRKALDEEKSMIDERLKRRKEAEDEAEKYEKLAEYRRQYAAISADSTRTKDAAELRKKIADLEKDIGWDIAEDEANTQKKIIEDQLKGYDEFVENGDEDLEAFLKDANNFAVEVTDILGSSHDDLMEWLKGNIEDYGYSLDEQKQKTLNEWEDMYKQMLGIVDTYWEQIAATLTDKDVFLNYLKMSKSYINASADEQAQMLYQWGDMFDKWTLAQKKDAEYSHTDEGLENTNKVTYSSGSGSKTTTTSYNNGSVSESNVKVLQSYLGVTADGKFGPATLAAAKAKFGSGVTDAASAWAAYINKNKTPSFTGMLSSIKSSIASSIVPAYATGGYVDYTGLAWVDGTKTKPESFLNANDTALLRSMLDAASTLNVKPFISNVDSGSFNSTSSNVGEVNITINQAELKDDADFEEVAKKVGESFIKELNKTGLTSVRFSF